MISDKISEKIYVKYLYNLLGKKIEFIEKNEEIHKKLY